MHKGAQLAKKAAIHIYLHAEACLLWTLHTYRHVYIYIYNFIHIRDCRVMLWERLSCWQSSAWTVKGVAFVVSLVLFVVSMPVPQNHCTLPISVFQLGPHPDSEAFLIQRLSCTFASFVLLAEFLQPGVCRALTNRRVLWWACDHSAVELGVCNERSFTHRLLKQMRSFGLAISCLVPRHA